MNKKKPFPWPFLIAAVLLVFFVSTLKNDILSMEHYNRVCQNPIVVTATVTMHDVQYDSEGSDDYLSYVSYEVDGMHYKNKLYETKSSKSALTPIGTKIQLEVSPEDPGVLISSLANSFFGAVLSLFMCALSVAFGWRFILRSRCSKGLLHTPDAETIQRDVKLTILGRVAPMFFLPFSFGCILLKWRYPSLVADHFYLLIFLCAAIGLWRLLILVRDIRIVTRADYTLRRDILVSKDIETSDDGDSYKLTYRSKDGTTWSTNTSHRNYDSVKEGNIVLAVYLPNKRQPLMHYDLDGDAR